MTITLPPALERMVKEKVESGLYASEADVVSEALRREFSHDAVHQWVRSSNDEVLHPPRVFPQFGEHYYATYFLDPHGFTLEVVCPTQDPAATP